MFRTSWLDTFFIPVNVRPKTNSLEGTSSFGVLVLVTESFVGSMSCNLTVDADSA